MRFFKLCTSRLRLVLDQPGLMVASSSSSNKATRRSTLSSKETAGWERTLRRVRFGDMVVVNLKARHQELAVLWRLKSQTSVRFDQLNWLLHLFNMVIKCQWVQLQDLTGHPTIGGMADWFQRNRRSRCQKSGSDQSS